MVFITQLDTASRLPGCKLTDDGIQGATVMAIGRLLCPGYVFQVQLAPVEAALGAEMSVQTSEPCYVPPRLPNVACCSVMKGLTAFVPHLLEGEAGVGELPRPHPVLLSFWEAATASLQQDLVSLVRCHVDCYSVGYFCPKGVEGWRIILESLLHGYLIVIVFGGWFRMIDLKRQGGFDDVVASSPAPCC